MQRSTPPGESAIHASLRLWHDWVSYLVHDPRSPVQIAMAMLAFPDSHPERDDNIGTARLALESSMSMLRDLVDTDRIRHGALVARREVCDLAALASRIGRNLVLEHRVQVVSEGDTTIALDPALLGRVLATVISNADRRARSGPLRVLVRGAQSAVTLRVVDDGPRVPPEQVEALFDPWRAVEVGVQRSTVVGLAFCRVVCEAHAGSMHLDSAEDGAVALALTLPRL